MSLKLFLKFFNGQIANFQKRHNFLVCRVHGEVISDEIAALNRALLEVEEKASKYSPCNV